MGDRNESSKDGETAREGASSGETERPGDESGHGEEHRDASDGEHRGASDEERRGASDDEHQGASDGIEDEHAAGDDSRIYHRKITPDADDANRRLLRLLADVEGCEVTDLPPLYERVDHLVENLFTEPPPAEAQAELAFSYCGYRVELDQAGNVSLMKIGDESSIAPGE